MFATQVRGLKLSEILWPIYSYLWDFSATVELRLLSVRCCRLLYSRLVSNVKHYILHEQIFQFHAWKFWSFAANRTRVLSFLSPMFFHCASWPRHLSHLSVVTLNLPLQSQVWLVFARESSGWGTISVVLCCSNSEILLGLPSHHPVLTQSTIHHYVTLTIALLHPKVGITCHI